MAIQVGDKLPEVKLKAVTSEGMKDVATGDLFGGKKVVLFALPGAFTPTCSAKHLPGFVAKADEIRGRGVDAILCLSVNDAFVMDAWGKAQGAGDKVVMVADGNAEFSRAVGLDFDGSNFGMGTRSQRYAMIVEDGVVLAIGGLRPVEPGHLEIKTMHTVAAARGRGLGRVVLEALVAEAADRGAHRLSLETGTHEAFEPARTLYASLGFEPCPPFGDYPASEHSVCMTRRLG